MSRQPDWEHQLVSGEIFAVLRAWCRQTEAGVANVASEIVLADYIDVVPDVIWISQKQLKSALQTDRKLHNIPELVVEVLSADLEYARQDREVKRKRYSRLDTKEYWVVNWRERTTEVYQRQDAVLELDRTLNETDTLESLLLPGFRCKVSELFVGL